MAKIIDFKTRKVLADLPVVKKIKPSDMSQEDLREVSLWVNELKQTPEFQRYFKNWGKVKVHF